MNTDLVKESAAALAATSPLRRFMMRYMGVSHYLGHETREGWVGFLPFYLFWCSQCDHYGKSYLQGYRRSLVCPHCTPRFARGEKLQIVK